MSSIAALAEAFDNFAANDDTLRDLLVAQDDTELAEIEAERSMLNAGLDARKERIMLRRHAKLDEFAQRKLELRAIVDGKA